MSSGFAAHLAEEAGDAKTSSVATANAVQPLVALQEVDDRARRPRTQVARGDALLDGLDDLRLAVLEDRIPAQRLQALARNLRSRAGDSADPELQEIVDAIELRVAVELAKRGVEA